MPENLAYPDSFYFYIGLTFFPRIFGAGHAFLYEFQVSEETKTLSLHVHNKCERRSDWTLMRGCIDEDVMRNPPLHV
jgi:hypothetical protein